jgi:hypothetical protein
MKSRWLALLVRAMKTRMLTPTTARQPAAAIRKGFVFISYLRFSAPWWADMKGAEEMPAGILGNCAFSLLFMNTVSGTALHGSHAGGSFQL